jgi:succinate dehydrogenase hydrophobic anchor subunit
MLTTIIIVLLVIWALGLFGPATGGYRTWGGGYGYNGIGVLLVVLVVLVLLHVIAV